MRNLDRTCVMIADTLDELYTMADKLDVPLRAVQQAGLPIRRVHFRMVASKRGAAVAMGATPLSMDDLRCAIDRMNTPSQAEGESAEGGCGLWAT